MTNEEISLSLRRLSEPDYQKFSSSLIPNIPSGRILGVRLPALRKLAASLAKEGWQDYLKNAKDTTFEEIMLQGMVIGKVKASWEELKPYVQNFLPKIDNWSVCDSFCNGLKIAQREPQKIWEFLQPCLASQNVYEIRFALVMILKYFVDEEHLEENFAWFDRINHPDYYVKMAAAWAVSCCYVRFPKKTFEYLKEDKMDVFTHNKAIQKIRESLRVSREEKDALLSWKR